MAKTTICLGVLLVLLGLLAFVSNGNHALTPLIPAAIGFILSILGMGALTDDSKKRMLFMHIAVTVALLGFIGTAWGIVNYIEYLRGRLFPQPVLVEENAATACILLLLVLLCIRSFIVARKTRT